jgi:hypothetical protein
MNYVWNWWKCKDGKQKQKSKDRRVNKLFYLRKDSGGGGIDKGDA